jgi:hypothetical protein
MDLTVIILYAEKYMNIYNHEIRISISVLFEDILF